MFYELNYSKCFFWFRVKCLKQGIKNRNSVLNRVGKSAIFVLNRVREGGAGPHLATQGYIAFPPPPRVGAHRTYFRRDEPRKKITYLG